MSNPESQRPNYRSSDPFRGERELVNPDKSYRISEIKEKPGWVIRESNIKPFETEDGEGYSLERWKSVFHLMRDVYNIAIPETQAIVGHDGHGHERMYLLTRKVEGVALDQAALLPSDAAHHVENFFRNLARYLVDQFHQGNEYYSDFKTEQLMYGRVSGESRDRVYLVDLDLLSSRYDRVSEIYKRPEGRLSVELKILLEELNELSDKFYPKQNFDSARALIEEYIVEVEGRQNI